MDILIAALKVIDAAMWLVWIAYVWATFWQFASMSARLKDVEAQLDKLSEDGGE